MKSTISMSVLKTPYVPAVHMMLSPAVCPASLRRSFDDVMINIKIRFENVLKKVKKYSA